MGRRLGELLKTHDRSWPWRMPERPLESTMVWWPDCGPRGTRRRGCTRGCGRAPSSPREAHRRGRRGCHHRRWVVGLEGCGQFEEVGIDAELLGLACWSMKDMVVFEGRRTSSSAATCESAPGELVPWVRATRAAGSPAGNVERGSMIRMKGAAGAVGRETEEPNDLKRTQARRCHQPWWQRHTRLLL